MPTDRVFPLSGPLPRPGPTPRVALVGQARSGKSRIFRAASSTSIQHQRLAGVGQAYEECLVEVDHKQISLVDLPPISSLHHLHGDTSSVLKYLLWGDRWPQIIGDAADAQPSHASFAAPDVLLLVMDATSLERDLELALELAQIGKPMVVALNRMDEARNKRLYINIDQLESNLGAVVIPTVAHMGMGLDALFAAVIDSARQRRAPKPQPPSTFISSQLTAIADIVAQTEVAAAFSTPSTFLVMQLAENNDDFYSGLRRRFPDQANAVLTARTAADASLPRPLAEEIHADRHHRAALMFEDVTRPGGGEKMPRWHRWTDELFLHPRLGFVGVMATLALVLFVVFEVSAFLDSITVARIIDFAEPWRPDDLSGVIARAVFDGCVGLLGIVIPYMLPLLLLLVLLEESGVMHRVAFVLDRGFHLLGLHGGIAMPFLIGLGCNVPAITATAAVSQGRDRIVASMLISFLPCSARSAILLAIGGKYLGGLGVFALFMLTPLVIGLVGKLLSHRYPETTPGVIQQIPPFALPAAGIVLKGVWERSRDIITVVLPLLVAGGMVLALLQYYGADVWINLVLSPITSWWLGLPMVLGVPLLFGVLRKELSLLMVYQALGSQDVGAFLDTAQIASFLAFVTFYVPCVSTTAIMLKLLGWREAIFAVLLSTMVALLVAAAVRWPLVLLS